MEYWTVMMVTILSGMMDGAQFAIPYQSMVECEAAIDSVSETFSYDYNVGCIETDAASGSIRPQRRPEGSTNG